MTLNEQGRRAQAECLRRYLGQAEGHSPQAVEEAARAAELGHVEFDPEWLEGLAPRAHEPRQPGPGAQAQGEAEPEAGT